MGLFASREMEEVLEDETLEADLVAEVGRIQRDLERSNEALRTCLAEGSEVLTASMMGIDLMKEVREIKGDRKRVPMDERVKAHVKQLLEAVKELQQKEKDVHVTHVEIRRKLRQLCIKAGPPDTEALIRQLILLSTTYTSELLSQQNMTASIAANLTTAADYLTSSHLILTTNPREKKPLIANESVGTAHCLGSRGRLGSMHPSHGFADFTLNNTR